jgi:ABC-type glycerol-3-phosphate transport system substrate-binding protein
MPRVRALVHYEAETTVTVEVPEDEYGYAEVLAAVYASGELLDAIVLDVYDYEEAPL